MRATVLHLAGHVSGRRIPLVLDNGEHLLAWSLPVDRLLRGCPAAGREPLALTGETILRSDAVSGRVYGGYRRGEAPASEHSELLRQASKFVD